MTRKITLALTLEFGEIEAETRNRFARQTTLAPEDIGYLKDSATDEIAKAFADQAVRNFNDVKSSMDIDDFLRDNDIFGLIEGWTIDDIQSPKDASSKTISMAKIAAMAEARFNSKQAHIKELSGFDGPKWADIDSDTIELEKRDMIAAVTATGHEVAP